LAGETAVELEKDAGNRWAVGHHGYAMVYVLGCLCQLDCADGCRGADSNGRKIEFEFKSRCVCWCCNLAGVWVGGCHWFGIGRLIAIWGGGGWCGQRCG